MSNKSDGSVKEFWNVFNSMKLGLVLLGLVALVAGIGTLIPQESMDPKAAQAVADIWKNLGFTDIYYSSWFLFLLGLLCTNLIVCNVQRFKKYYKLTFALKPPQESSNVPQKINTIINHNNAEILKKKAEENLKKRGFHIIQVEEDNKWSFIAQKHALGNWGSFLTHLAFILLVLGSLIGSLLGFKGYLLAAEGSVIPIQEIYIHKGQVKENFSVKINSVEDRILPNGERDNWYTDLSILESDQEVQHNTISVNHPLIYKGITFYQSSYIPGAVFTIEMNGMKYPISLQSGGGNYYKAPGTNLYFVLAAIDSASQNPVILYQVFDQFQEVKRGELALGQSENIQDSYTIIFDKPTAFTGLHVKADPGVGVVWLGCGLLMLGLLLSFYWRPLRIAGVLDSNKEPVLTLGAYSGRFNMEIIKEFDQLVDDLRA
jgi:cytochrome c biogenesis protein